MVLRGNGLGIKLGLLFFFIEPPLKSSPNDKLFPSFKSGEIYLLETTHGTSNCHFVIFWEAFAIWAGGATTAHLAYGLIPANTCPTQNSNGRCLGYVVFECHAKFQVNWESFAHTRINKNINFQGFSSRATQGKWASPPKGQRKGWEGLSPFTLCAKSFFKIPKAYPPTPSWPPRRRRRRTPVSEGKAGVNRVCVHKTSLAMP